VVDNSKCKYCGLCAKECTGKAIQFKRYVPSVTIIISRCFACGFCLKVCNRNGISVKKKLSGTILQGNIDGRQFIGARAEKSIEFYIPLLTALLQRLNAENTVICDFGPGNGKTFSFLLPKMDVAVIVLKSGRAWETRLELLIETINEANVPTGLILNRTLKNDPFVAHIRAYCLLNHLPLLGIIPFSDNSQPIVDEEYEYSLSEEYTEIWLKINELSGASRWTEKRSSNNLHIKI